MLSTLLQYMLQTPCDIRDEAKSLSLLLNSAVKPIDKQRHLKGDRIQNKCKVWGWITYLFKSPNWSTYVVLVVCIPIDDCIPSIKMRFLELPACLWYFWLMIDRKSCLRKIPDEEVRKVWENFYGGEVWCDLHTCNNVFHIPPCYQSSNKWLKKSNTNFCSIEPVFCDESAPRRLNQCGSSHATFMSKSFSFLCY